MIIFSGILFFHLGSSLNFTVAFHEILYSVEDPERREKYSGMTRNDLPEGEGQMSWRDGKVYKGRWKNGMLHGHGEIIFSHQDICLKFEGEFKEGKKCGRGFFLWKNNSKYEGDFENDMKHGQGIHKYEKANITDFYDGQWKSGV